MDQETQNKLDQMQKTIQDLRKLVDSLQSDLKNFRRDYDHHAHTGRDLTNKVKTSDLL